LVPGSNELRKAIYKIDKSDDSKMEMDVMTENKITEKFFEYAAT